MERFYLMLRQMGIAHAQEKGGCRLGPRAMSHSEKFAERLSGDDPLGVNNCSVSRKWSDPYRQSVKANTHG